MTMVEVIEIWMTVKVGGEAFRADTNENMKLVAYIVNGYPIKLEDGFALERTQVSKEEAERILARANNL